MERQLDANLNGTLGHPASCQVVRAGKVVCLAEGWLSIRKQGERLGSLRRSGALRVVIRQTIDMVGDVQTDLKLIGPPLQVNLSVSEGGQLRARGPTQIVRLLTWSKPPAYNRATSLGCCGQVEDGAYDDHDSRDSGPHEPRYSRCASALLALPWKSCLCLFYPGRPLGPV